MSERTWARAAWRLSEQVGALTTERDELRAALRDLRAWVIAPRSVQQYEEVRARIDALIGPYGEQGAQSANVSKGVKSIA